MIVELGTAPGVSLWNAACSTDVASYLTPKRHCNHKKARILGFVKDPSFFLDYNLLFFDNRHADTGQERGRPFKGSAFVFCFGLSRGQPLFFVFH
jgi:hypothetical protein